jgi:acid phosphatase class B
VLFYAQIVIFKKLANLRGGEIDMLGSLLKSRKALSTVVTTLIILVVSVLLATVVTMYSINVTTTRVQEESLFLTKPHVWYNTTGSWSQAAIIIINTGGKDVVLDKVTVRGQELNWTYVFYWRTTTAITQDLEVTSDQLNISQTTQNITVEGQSRTFTRADSDLTLRSGWTMVLYIDSPDSITVSDVGTTVGITIFSASAQYYKEVNVQAAQ